MWVEDVINWGAPVLWVDVTGLLNILLTFAEHHLRRDQLQKSWYHVGYLGNHNTRGTALPSRPLLSGRAVFLPQKASSPFLLVHVQLLWLFSCAPFTFPASTGPIEGLTLCEQDVPQASVAVDTAVRFPKEARSSKFSLWSQEIAVLF